MKLLSKYTRTTKHSPGWHASVRVYVYIQA